MNMDDMNKAICAASAMQDQLQAVIRDSVESMPNEVLFLAIMESGERTRTAIAKVNGVAFSDESVGNLLNAMRETAFTLVLTNEVQRRGTVALESSKKKKRKDAQ